MSFRIYIKYLMLAALQLLNDMSSASIHSRDDTEGEIRVAVNVAIMLALILISLLTFYFCGLIWKSTFFNVNFLAAVTVSLLVGLKMKTGHLLALVLTSIAVAFAVESILTSTGIVRYLEDNSLPFVISSWALMMILILGFSDLLRSCILRLEIFSKLEGWKTIPTIIVSSAFIAFFVWEGYVAFGGVRVEIMYISMILLGILCAFRCSMEWSTSVAVTGVFLGGYLELIGFLGGLWDYTFNEGLPLFITISWALNAWAVYGIASLAGFDPSRSMAARALEGT